MSNIHKEFVFSEEIKTSLNTCWQSPSNIALIKYWGKEKNQIPKNPSISFTLSKCLTTTSVQFEPRVDKSSTYSYAFYFENKETPSFLPKIEAFFERIVPYVPYLKTHHMVIHSENSFPHSSGIASSASAMSALALCLLEPEKENSDKGEDYFNQKASFLARLGSGSASRSVQGPAVVWGKSDFFRESTDLYGIKMPSLHPIFQNYCDSILIVDVGEKKVSSTTGHELMNNHPYANERFAQAVERMEKIKCILEKGEIADFISLVESEALTLHAMMMTANPYFILLKPNTLKIIEKIWEYRKETDSKVCFTLDAGANIHLLYPEKEKNSVKEFINTTLSSYCQEKKVIFDTVGNGAKKISL